MDEKTMWRDMGKIPSIDQDEIVEGCVRGMTQNYNRLSNKPSINGVTLQGDKTTQDLGLGVTDKNYTYTQTEASDTWVITHNLNKYPTISVIDSANNEVIGEVTYDSLNQVTVRFKGEFKGTATLN